MCPFKILKPTHQPCSGKNKQVVFNACCMDMKQQKIDVLHLSTNEIFKQKYKLKNEKNIKNFAFTKCTILK
jgi:hypothetical protein